MLVENASAGVHRLPSYVECQMSLAVFDVRHLQTVAKDPQRNARVILGGSLNRSGMDAERVSNVREIEETRFVAERPRSMSLLGRARATMPRGVPMSWMDDMWEHPPMWVETGSGAYFTDVDGHEYLDMYVADMSAFCGHAPSAVVEAVKRLAQTTARDGWDARDEPATVVPPPDKLRLSQ
jgi:hypothetical protein